MIETRLARKDTPLVDRIQRAWTIEGFIILAIMAVWTLMLLSLAPSLIMLVVCAVLLGVGALLLSVALVSGSAISQFFFAGAVGFTTLLIGLAVFLESSVNVGVLCSSATTFLCLDLLRLHELRRRNALVSTTLFSNGLLWASGIVVLSAVLVLMVARPGEATLSWVYLPAATIAVFVVVAGLGFWAIRDRARQSGARYDPVIVTPPAPSLVDPLVAEAHNATTMMHGSPPPPTQSSPGPPPPKTKRGRRNR